MPYHTVSEFWFDDNDARLAAFATPEWKAAAEDAASHWASRVHLFTEGKFLSSKIIDIPGVALQATQFLLILVINVIYYLVNEYGRYY